MGRIISLLLALVFVCTSMFMSFAHSGRTDASGGHRDNKNASGLGSYHYHHGYGPHLHPNGVCPYSVNTGTSNSGKSSTTTSVQSKQSNTANTASSSTVEKKKVTVIAEKTTIYETASENSDKILTAKKGYTFTPTGSTKSFWKLEFKRKNDDTIYIGYILKSDTTE